MIVYRTYSELRIRCSVLLHSVLGADSVFAADHFYESMPLVLVDNTCLYLTKLIEDFPQLIIGHSKHRLAFSQVYARENLRDTANE